MSSTGNLVLDSIRTDDTEVLRRLTQAIRVLGANNAAIAPLLEQADATIGVFQQNQPRVDGNVTFVVPAQTLNDWCTELRGREPPIDPVPGIHWKEDHGCHYKNTEPLSYLENEHEAGNREKDEAIRLAGPNNPPGRDDLQFAYERGAYQARVRNRAARAHQPTWALLARQVDVDTRSEDVLIRYLPGRELKEPDWYYTVRELRRHGEAHGYTLAHFKSALDRMVSHFDAKMRIVTEHMDANQMATYLSNLTLPESEYEVVESQIKSLTRQPGEKIKAVMSKLKALAEILHRNVEPPQERQTVIDKLMVTGLIGFTTGETRANLIATIDQCKRNRLPMTWERLADGVASAESLHGQPTVPLSLSEGNQSVLTYNVGIGVQTGIRGIGPPVLTGLGIGAGPPRRQHRQDPNPYVAGLLYEQPHYPGYEVAQPAAQQGQQQQPRGNRQARGDNRRIADPAALREREAADARARAAAAEAEAVAAREEAALREAEAAAARTPPQVPQRTDSLGLEQGARPRLANPFENLVRTVTDMALHRNGVRDEQVLGENRRPPSDGSSTSTLDTSRHNASFRSANASEADEVDLDETFMQLGAAGPPGTPGARLPAAALEPSPTILRSGRILQPPDAVNQNVHHSQLLNLFATAVAEKTNQLQKSNRSKSWSKDRSASKDRKENNGKKDSRESRSRQSKSSDRRKDDRSKSKRDQSRDSSRGRSSSRESRGRGDSRSKGRDRSESRDSRRSDSSRKSSRDSSKGNSDQKGRSRSDRRSNSRDRGSRNRSWDPKEMEKGNNCSRDYDPKKSKHCWKCNTVDEHHEFQCKKFSMRSKKKCSNCGLGYHWPIECDQPQRQGNK